MEDATKWEEEAKEEEEEEEEEAQEEAEGAEDDDGTDLRGRGDRRNRELIFGSTYSVMSAVERKRCG